MALIKIVVFAVFILHNGAVLPSLARKYSNLKGLFVPVFTPLHEDGRLRLEVIPRYAQYLKENNVPGVFIAGTVGEGTMFSVPEMQALISAWTAAGRAHNLKTTVQISGRPIPGAQFLARYCEKEGVDAIVALPDLFYKPSTVDQLVYNMETIANATPHTPLVYNDDRAVTGVQVDMVEFVVKAAQRIPSFIGLKEETFDQALRVQPIIKEKDLTIFIADPINIAPGLLMGFTNFIITEIIFFPRAFKAIVAFVQTCDRNKTIDISKRLMEISNAIRTVQDRSNPVPALKVAMTMITGIDVGPPRPPQVPLTKAQENELKRRLRYFKINLAGGTSKS